MCSLLRTNWRLFIENNNNKEDRNHHHHHHRSRTVCVRITDLVFFVTLEILPSSLVHSFVLTMIIMMMIWHIDDDDDDHGVTTLWILDLDIDCPEVAYGIS